MAPEQYSYWRWYHWCSLGDDLTAKSEPRAIQGIPEKPQALESCFHGVPCGGSSPWNGQWQLLFTETPFYSHGLYSNRYQDQILIHSTDKEEEQPFTRSNVGCLWDNPCWMLMTSNKAGAPITSFPFHHWIHQEYNTTFTKWCSQNLLSYLRAKLRARGNAHKCGLERCIVHQDSTTRTVCPPMCSGQSLAWQDRALPTRLGWVFDCSLCSRTWKTYIAPSLVKLTRAACTSWNCTINKSMKNTSSPRRLTCFQRLRLGEFISYIQLPHFKEPGQWGSFKTQGTVELGSKSGRVSDSQMPFPLTYTHIHTHH